MVFSHVNPNDVTWNSTKVTIWSAVEPCVGVITGCIPSLRPLISGRCWVRGAIRPQPMETSSTSSQLPWIKHHYQVDNCDVELVRPGRSGSDISYEGFAFATKSVAQRGDSGDNFRVEDVDVPFGNIAVKTEIRWSWNERMDYDSRLY